MSQSGLMVKWKYFYMHYHLRQTVVAVLVIFVCTFIKDPSRWQKASVMTRSRSLHGSWRKSIFKTSPSQLPEWAMYKEIFTFTSCVHLLPCLTFARNSGEYINTDTISVLFLILAKNLWEHKFETQFSCCEWCEWELVVWYSDLFWVKSSGQTSSSKMSKEDKIVCF